MGQQIISEIKSLGKPSIDSPLNLSKEEYVTDDDRILYNVNLKEYKKNLKNNVQDPVTFELAGPREKIYFNPKTTKSAIVTCGGLCPGINNVIRAIVMTLYYVYGAKNVIGIRYGYEGFNPDFGHEVIDLVPKEVEYIDEMGGTILSSSRGPQEASLIVDTIEQLNINILFTIGGDGTLKGASAIQKEIEKRGLKVAVVGIPKTIDNDISLVAKSFGFETAFSKAVESIRSAHSEATGAPYGIGLVKFMGRQSGYIAANSALALKHVNFVLIPEVDFDLEGPNGFLKHLEDRLVNRKHCVIVVAEGAGQKFFINNKETDASGNTKLSDIGLFLKEKIIKHFKEKNIEVNLKYIDPSYIIRSVPADANDSVFCGFLAQDAVHAAMTGKTGLIISVWNNMFIHLPIDTAVMKRKTVDPNKKLWRSVIESTGQKVMLNSIED